MERGKFIVFEGGEGAGKSTQCELLEAHLKSLSIPVHRTREPGGTPAAELLREVIVTGSGAWPPMVEAMVMSAARYDHFWNLIKPCLDRGTWVICDRFIASTNAYQGRAGGVPQQDLDVLHSFAIKHFRPDLTITLDIDPAVGLQRAFGRGDKSRFEAKPIEYHQMIRESFCDQAMGRPGNVIISADNSVEDIAARVRSEVAVLAHIPETAQEVDE